MNKVFTKEQQWLLHPDYLEKLRQSPQCMFLWQHYYRMMGNLMENYQDELESSVFAGIAKYINEQQLNFIIDYCITDKIKEDISNKRQYGRVNTEEDDPDDIMEALWKHPRSNSKFRVAMSELMECYQGQIEDELANNPKRNLKAERFEEIKALFQLNDDEFSLFLAVVIRDSGMCNFRVGQLAVKINFFANLLNISQAKLLKMIAPTEKLRRYKCITDDIDVNPELTMFLVGIDDKPLVSNFYSKLDAEALPWEFYGVLAEKHGTILKTLLKSRSDAKGVNILLYGEPGTGKTSFAKSLANELGMTLYNIEQKMSSDSGDKSEYSTNFRFAALQACDNQVDTTHSLIVIDEADEMLRGQYGGLLSMFAGSAPAGDKGMLNSVLDEVKTSCIWITNTTSDDLDPSSRRRFDYSIKFGKMSREQREKIWHNSLDKHGVKRYLSAELIGSLANKYEVSAGGIDITVSNIAGILKHDAGQFSQIEVLIEQLISPHCQLLNIKPQTGSRVNDNYSLDGLNVKGKISPAQIITAAKRFRQEREQHTVPSPDAPRMNLLLTGVPGTGKTEFVKYLGKSLACKVMTRMSSDLLDMYVGGTEKNIRQAFKAAEEENAILFIDEADGMFRSREMSKRSWEVTQVNELLYAMENFKSILICATNFADNLDKATLRRFTFKLEFDYLTTAGKELFFKQFFSKLYSGRLKRAEKEHLADIANLTPGDFRTVRQGVYYLKPDNISATHLIEALAAESDAKRNLSASVKTIGFAAN
ncbi:MAG: AAA family ATPase [Victivallaceae bacterium]|nr:AAA family ATPase [Victivallaceae bacterium]